MVMQGLEKQYIEFTAPGDVAGMKILMADANTLWMYSPEFKKVRKIAAHAQSQGFLGSEFTPEDMAMAKLSRSYDAELVGKQGNETTLELRPKAEGVSSYSKLEIVIDSTKGGVTIIRYFDGSGNLVRVQSREAWQKIGGAPMPTRITMENKKNGNKTVINLSNVKVNQGVDEATFSRRNLLRG
jgi:outer membrane lipoprotein-sorting protein